MSGTGAAVFLAIALALPPSVAAQEVAASRVSEIGATSHRRTLAGHLFTQSTPVTTPFTSTYVQLGIGSGLADGDGPRINPDGTLGDDIDYPVAGVVQTAIFQVGIADWWAVRAGITGSIYGGRTRAAALAVGGVIQLRGMVGTTLSHQVHRTLRIGVLADLQTVPRGIIDVLDAVRQSVEAGEVSDAELVDRTSSVTVGGGLSAAFAPHEAFGVVVTGRYLRDDVVSGVDAEVDVISLGATADIDLGAFSNAPFTVLGAYRLDEPLETTMAARSHLAEVDLYYTRGSELVVGPGMEVRWYHIRPGVEVRSFTALIDVYYYW